MTGYVTVCYSNQSEEVFKRAPMRIRNGVRTNELIKRKIRKNEKENEDYYIKTDPNFDNYTYSTCHRSLRKVLLPGDILFFRTLWRGKEYFIGYFDIVYKSTYKDDNKCYALPQTSLLIPGYRYVITPSLVQRLNPNANLSRSVNENRFISYYLARSYLKLTLENTRFLKSELDKFKQS